MAIKQLATRDFNKTQLLNAVAHNLAADPGSPVEGQFIWRTDTKTYRVYNGTSWIDLASSAQAIAATIVDAKGDLISATAADTVAREAVGANGTFYVADSAQATGHSWRTIAASDIPNDAITFARMQNINTDVLLGRDTAAAGDPEEISVGGGLVFTGAAGIQTTAFTGDVTKTLGGTALTIAANVVDNTKAADMSQSTIKGRAAGAGTGDPTDLSVAQVKAILNYIGTDVTFTPGSNIASTNVQAAIEEVVADLTALINTTIEGRSWKDAVQAATTAALPSLTYSAGAGTLTATANAALPAQDGVTLVVGESLLVKDQASTFQNGIYDVTQVGTVGTPFILTRRFDGSTAAELSDATVLIAGGTTGAGDIYTQANTLADLTAAAQAWTKTGEGNTTYTADGSTIELVGNSFRIHANAAGNGLTGGGGSALAVNPGTGLEISADTVRIAAAAAGNGLVGGGGAALDVNPGTGLEISADTVRIAAAAAGNGLTGGAGSALAVGAGTGISVAADTVAVDTAVVVRKTTGVLTGGALSEVLTHNLNTQNVVVAVRNNAAPYEEVEVEKEATTVNTVTIRAAANLPASYTWVVMG